MYGAMLRRQASTNSCCFRDNVAAPKETQLSARAALVVLGGLHAQRQSRPVVKQSARELLVHVCAVVEELTPLLRLPVEVADEIVWVPVQVRAGGFEFSAAWTQFVEHRFGGGRAYSIADVLICLCGDRSVQSNALRCALLGQVSTYLSVALARIAAAARTQPHRVLLPALRVPNGSLRKRVDPGIVLRIVEDHGFSAGGLVRRRDGVDLRLGQQTARDCVSSFLAVYTSKLRAALQGRRRLALVFDGSGFNGEDLQVFVVWSRADGVLAALHPQASALVVLKRWEHS